MIDGRWKIENETMKDGSWMTEDGRWKMKDGYMEDER